MAVDWTRYTDDGRIEGDDATRTATVTTYDEAGVVTSTRPYTAAENADADQRAADATAAANAAQLEADTSGDLTNLRAAIDALALLLADEATVGSLRNIMGPSGAAAGTTSLRALRAQSNTAVISAASIKALIDLDIAAVQRQIDDAQATRRIARQTLRLAKAMVGDYSSADVGAEAANAQG